MVISEVETDLLIYDRRRHRAHCLNQTAAFVWRHCDGQTTVEQLSALLRDELEAAADDQTVWLALTQLDKARLLQSPVSAPDEVAAFSRRELLRRAGLAAAGVALVPVVSSIVAPTAYAVVSCIGEGSACEKGSGATPCCPPFKCRRKKGKQRICKE
jgi:hypothetical protein